MTKTDYKNQQRVERLHRRFNSTLRRMYSIRREGMQKIGLQSHAAELAEQINELTGAMPTYEPE